MFVVEVIPIKKGFGKELLSYFSPTPIETGLIVKVPVRGRLISALVVSSGPVKEQKAELKASQFALRKIKPGGARKFFEDAWLDAAKNAAAFFAAPLGSVIAASTPVSILENISKLLLPKEPTDKKRKTDSPLKNEVVCIQTEDNERFGHYRAAIREAFARNQSVFVCLPTIEDVRVAEAELQRGIIGFTYTFHSDIPAADLLKNWKKVMKEKHPVLFIATAQWFVIRRPDLGLIILDKENSSGWKTLARPYMDMRKMAEFFAREKGVRLILGSHLLRVETLWRYKQDEVFPFESVKFRLSSGAQTALVGMVHKDVERQRKFRTISPELASMIRIAIEESKNVFIYATRKGLASVTTCDDCGQEVNCHNCGSPMILYKRAEVNVFRCHQCGSERNAKEVCKNCGSWRLTPLGIGIERVIDEINNFFPNATVLQISRDSTTPLRASQMVERFYKTPGAILVGTEMALHYLREPADFTAVASIDALFSVPGFRIREKIFNIVLTVRGLAREASLVQVRKAEVRTLELALSGNILDFYKMEIDDRELLQYPPFSIFVKITSRGTKAVVGKDSEFLADYFKEWEPTIFNSRSERRDAQAAVNCVLKIPRGEYPNMELLSQLLALPPNFEIKVDPDNLL